MVTAAVTTTAKIYTVANEETAITAILFCYSHFVNSKSRTWTKHNQRQSKMLGRVPTSDRTKYTVSYSAISRNTCNTLSLPKGTSSSKDEATEIRVSESQKSGHEVKRVWKGNGTGFGYFGKRCLFLIQAINQGGMHRRHCLQNLFEDTEFLSMLVVRGRVEFSKIYRLRLKWQQ